MSGIVAIVGRPNVGKSTLFNRLIEDRQAIVHDESGVTRDRNYGQVDWNGREFSIIDTGGYVPRSEDIFEKAIREQVHIAMEEADLMIFMVDAMAGLTSLDREFASMVRKSTKKVILVTNKVDGAKQMDLIYDFYELGLDELIPVSAVNGGGTGELLDMVVENLPDETTDEFEEDIPKIAIVGRPNVGKSSLVNALLGKDANIVTPIAGTTRDSIHSRYKAFGNDLILIDTAGLRKKAKVSENIEFYSTLRTIKAIEECDIVVLMLDATQGLEAQDMNIVSLIIKYSKGVVINVNKWDLIEEKRTHTARDMEKEIRERMAPFSDVPIVFSSVKDKQRLLKVLEATKQVYQNKTKEIPTSLLNEVMLAAVARHHAPSVRGRIIRIKYITQVDQVKIPTFLFFTNHPKLIQESYKRYLENQLREHFDFMGTPINIFFRQK